MINDGKAFIEEAVVLENEGKIPEAVSLYKKGIQIIENECKNMCNNDERLLGMLLDCHKVTELETHLCDLELKISGSFLIMLEERKIGHGEKGHGYETIFGKYIDPSLTTVSIDDPFVCNAYQVDNLTRFCELLVAMAANLKTINITTTTKEAESGFNNRSALTTLQASLREVGVTMHFKIVNQKDLHHRSFEFDNGHVIKIDRGLDLYLPANRFSLGSFDLNMRVCRSADITVYKKSGAVASENTNGSATAAESAEGGAKGEESVHTVPQETANNESVAEGAWPRAQPPAADTDTEWTQTTRPRSGSVKPKFADSKYRTVRCNRFPNCYLGEKCNFIHPTEPCWYPERCAYTAKKCRYIHMCGPNNPCTPETCVYHGYTHVPMTPLQMQANEQMAQMSQRGRSILKTNGGERHRSQSRVSFASETK